jgi:large subunit ribosomal protein L32
MALPKRRSSKARQGNREAGKALKVPNLIPCPNCQELMKPHHICPECGYYAGREVVETEEE